MGTSRMRPGTIPVTTATTTTMNMITDMRTPMGVTYMPWLPGR